MNEGILNKIGHVLWRRSTEGWDPRLWGRTKAGDGKVGAKDFEELKRLYYGTAFTCINANAANMASVPLHYYVIKGSKSQQLNVRAKEVPAQVKDKLMERESVQRWMQRAHGEDIEEVLDHPVLTLLSKVNTRYTRQQLFELTGQYLEGLGNCFWRVKKADVAGKKLPVSIWFLDPSKMKPEFNDDGSVKTYEYGTGKDKEIIPGDEVIHFLYPSFLDPFWGLSPLFGASIAANIEQRIQIYSHNTFDNMGVPLAALMSESPMREEDVKKIMEQIENKAKGFRKANTMVALANVGKGAKIEKLGFNPDEMGFLNGADKAREWVANAFGYPVSMLTDAGSNKAVSKTGDTRYWRNTITPKLVRISEELTESLSVLYADNGFFAHEDCVPEDGLMKAQERKINLSVPYSTTNEEREKDKKEPIEGGDTVWVPAGMVPLDQAGQETDAQMAARAVRIMDIARAQDRAKRRAK